MWLLDWLIARWQRVNEVFETWYWRIRDAFENYWAQFWYVVIVWYGQAYTFFREKVNQLWDVVIYWYPRIKAAISDYWGTLWQALTASWGFIWSNFYQGYKDIIDYTYSARVDIKDTFTRWKTEFAQFRADPIDYIAAKLGWTVFGWREFWLSPWHWIVRKLGGNIIFWDYFIQEPSWYLNQLINTWIDTHIPWYRDLVGYIIDRIGWVRSKWDWFWRDPFAFVIAQAGGNTWWWKLFVADPLSYINLYIYGYLRAEYPFLFTIYVWLTTKWDAFLREIGAFIADPYGYLTKKLQAWIEGWRDYIFGVVDDLFDQLQREIILHLMDWMSYVAPPIEAIDEIGPHFSSFTDTLDEWARAWKELKETWVKEAMVMMNAFAAELRGEKEMELLTPSETVIRYWQMLTPEQIQLIVSPPIKG